MAILIGSTGFVGGHLSRSYNFEQKINRSNVDSIIGSNTDLIVCAGLPAEKWRANLYPKDDWANMIGLTHILRSVRAKRAVLISTADVYQKPVNVDELTEPDLEGEGKYGVHRAWFERFFISCFSNTLTLRLPGLYAPDVRKNLVHDLLNGKADQWSKVNPHSTFQFFDIRQLWSLIEFSWVNEISLLNVTSEPILAQEVATLFGKELRSGNLPVEYDLRSIHAEKFGGQSGYIYNKASTLEGIAKLREFRLS